MAENEGVCLLCYFTPTFFRPHNFIYNDGNGVDLGPRPGYALPKGKKDSSPAKHQFSDLLQIWRKRVPEYAKNTPS